MKEETGLNTINNIYLNWILEYESLGIQCKEYVYISFVNKANIILNEESIDYKWCDFNEFLEKIDWFGDKKILKKVLTLAIKRLVFFKKEKTDKFKGGSRSYRNGIWIDRMYEEKLKDR